MNGPRALFLTILVATSIAAMPLSAAETDSEVFEAEAAHSSAPVDLQVQEENATTEGTVGYVEGYRYDDELPIDDRNDAARTGEELEAVVYRAMARLEVVRNLTFREEVAVSVISRESSRNLSSGSDGATETERLEENVRYESLFTVDRETSPDEEFATLYGGVVNGFYSPGRTGSSSSPTTRTNPGSTR